MFTFTIILIFVLSEAADACRDGSPGTLSDLRSASVNNTRLASVAVLHQIHTFVRHCSSPLFHDIGAFVEQLQQAVSDQEKKILEQQKLLREQQQRQAEAAAAEAAGQEGGDVSMTDGQGRRKQKAGNEDLNDVPAKRTRSSSSDSPARHDSSSPFGEPASEVTGAGTGGKSSESALEAVPAAAADKQSSDEPTQLKSAQPTPATQAQLRLAESDLATTPADCTPVESGTQPVEAPAVAASQAGGGSGEGELGEIGPADPTASIKAVGVGVQHPLGGPKPEKPKRRKKFTKDSVRVCASSFCTCLYNTFSFADLSLSIHWLCGKLC